MSCSSRGWWSSLRRRLGQVWLVLRIAAFALLAPLVARLRLDRLGPLLEPSRRVPGPTRERMRELANLVDRVLSAGRPVLRSGCLVRGLTRYYILRHAGAQVSLCFGVRMQDHGIDGHCWLEAEGAPFLEARDPRPLFTEMYRLSPRR